MDENAISQIILDSAICVHKALGGPGLLESVYRDSLAYELASRGLKVSKEVAVPVMYKGIAVGEPLRMDILVEDCVVIECKATEKDNPVFASQLLTYLRLQNRHLGLLINFGKARIVDGFRRIINGYRATEAANARDQHPSL
ncbi:MAG TPA: GxxExxY protein [Verrucomicrobia bacterium]|nr:GxxExxY protein [Verrucomicrobiota bacterium]